MGSYGRDSKSLMEDHTFIVVLCGSPCDLLPPLKVHVAVVTCAIISLDSRVVGVGM